MNLLVKVGYRKNSIHGILHQWIITCFTTNLDAQHCLYECETWYNSMFNLAKVKSSRRL